MSTFTNLLFHVVYSTKYRRPLIKPQWQNELYAYLGGILKQQKGTLLACGGVSNHVHLLAKLSPNVSISDALRLLKSNSSKWVNERDDIEIKFQWQPGYSAFSVSESVTDRVRQYIANQESHHARKSFEEEFIELLEKHRIAYDPKYVFEQEIIQ